jgi:para-aminobenzoate synthetase/4-amino-4-deoxychorismate lyase
VSLAAEPIARPSRDLRVKRAPTPVDPADRWLYHKTTRREVYAAALDAAAGYDDALLWNTRGEVTETCHGNVVAELDGARITPPVAAGLLPGTLRAWLLERGEIMERPLRLSDLARCAALYRINSVRGWQPIELDA